MKIRIEGNETEIRTFLIEQIKLNPGQIYKTVSKFYPNRVNSNDLLNGLVKTGKETVGRVYVELS